MAAAVKAAAVLTTIAAVVVATLWLQSRRRAAEVERTARLRHRLITRAKAGMPPGHPENLEAPGGLDLIEHGAEYVWFADQLADVQVPGTEGGSHAET